MNMADPFRKYPGAVYATETVGKDVTVHGFLRIAQRDEWVSQDTESRESLYAHSPRVLVAWRTFALVLHQDPTQRLKL